MNEQDIEDCVERRIDHLDRLFLQGAVTDKQYLDAVIDLNEWAEAKYNEVYRKDNMAVGAFA